MFRIELSAEIWLSTNSSRVCAFAFGKSASAAASAAVFASVTSPSIWTNE